MVKRANDIIGQKFGYLIVNEFSHKDKVSRNYYTCVCRCGNKKTIQQSNLLSGRSTSCGCSRKSTTILMNDDVQANSDLIYVDTAIGSLLYISAEQRELMSNEDYIEFKMKNPRHLANPFFLKKLDRVVEKSTGKVATVDESVYGDSAFYAIYDNGNRAFFFSFDEIYKLIS